MGDYEAEVTNMPNCDLGNTPGHAGSDQVPAVYDGKTKMGPWAFMCSPCFVKFGIGLGLGRGQKLVVRQI